jgi:hypothetical protein
MVAAAFPVLGVGAALADVRIVVKYTEVEHEIATDKIYRTDKSRIYTVTKNRVLKITSIDSGGTVTNSSAVLEQPGEGKNVAGVNYVNRARIDNGDIVTASFLESFVIETRIRTNGSSSCEATRNYKLLPGRDAFVDRTRVTRVDKTFSDIHAENITCSISETAD